MSWPEIEAERTAAFSNMFRNEEMTDVTIACEDDQIQAHKVILSAASPMLQNILNRNPHKYPLLYFHGITKAKMELILGFIYSGEVQVPMDDLDAFLKIAKELTIKGLVQNKDIYGLFDKPPIMDEKGELMEEKFSENTS